MSVGELAMTPRIWLVAVCCSNDSFNSLNNRTFSIAITAWSAKVSSSLIWIGVKGRTSMRRAPIVPTSSPCRRRGAIKKVRNPRIEPISGEIVLLAHVGNVERPMLAHPGKPWVVNIDLDAASRYGYGTKMSPYNHGIPLPESQHHVINPTNPCGALDDGIEHRLHIRGRAADDAEYFGRCGLMLQCLAQFCVALPEFLEQPNVFNRDDGLVGKSLEESDLLIGERTNFGPQHPQRSDSRPLPQQRRKRHAAVPIALLHRLGLWEFRLYGLCHISDYDGGSVQHCATWR